MVAKVIVSPIVGFFLKKARQNYFTKKFDSKYYISNEIEEHVTILTQPGDEYFSHVTPIDSSAISISDAIWNSVKEIGNKIKVIGADNTNTVSYTHLRAHETRHDLVCRLLLEKKQ